MLSSAPEPTTTAAEPAKAAAAATEAITAAPKSSATTEAIKATALKALEPLARRITTRPVLRLAVQITGSASTPGPIETASP